MPASFRLATFNLENLNVSRGHENEFERRIVVLRPTLQEIAADVLCLQEVDAQKVSPHGSRQFLALDRLLSATAYQNYYQATSVRPGSVMPADIHNLVILSRWPIIEQRQLHHDIVAKWRWTPPAEGSSMPPSVEIEWDRPLLYARISLPGDSALHVINLHLRAPRAVPIPGRSKNVRCASSQTWAEGQFVAAQRREGQALETRLFVEHLFDHEPNALIAICGDLNSEEHDTPARLLMGMPDEETGNTSRRAMIPLGSRVEKARRFTTVHAKRPVLVDNILASRTLAARCKDVAIFNKGLQDEVEAKEPILGSLHAPVIAAFVLNDSNVERVVKPDQKT